MGIYGASKSLSLYLYTTVPAQRGSAVHIVAYVKTFMYNFPS